MRVVVVADKSAVVEVVAQQTSGMRSGETLRKRGVKSRRRKKIQLPRPQR
jgi:hypothetical protein